MKKKVLGLVCLMASLTALSACDEKDLNIKKDDVVDIDNNDDIVIDERSEDVITITLEDKVYDATPATVSATSLSNLYVKLEYKLYDQDDSTYTDVTPTIPGVYTVKATTLGNDNYKPCEETKTLNIVKKTDSITLNTQDKMYDGNTPVVSAVSVSGLQVKIEYKLLGTSDDTYTETAPTNAGEYYVRASTLGNEIYKTASAKKILNIGRVSNDIEISVSDKDYDGNPIDVDITTSFNATPDVYYKLESETDDAYTKEVPTDAGDYIVKAEYKDNVNFKDIVKYEAFSIFKIDDEIKINVDNKKYDGEEISVNATSKANLNMTISYKKYGADDSTYTDVAPKEVGNYIVKVETEGNENYNTTSKIKEFRIYNEILPDDFINYLDTDSHVKVSTAKEFLDAIYNARFDYTNEIKEIVGEKDYIERKNVRKNESNWINAITKGLYLKNNDDTYTQIPSDTPFSDTSYTADMTYYEDSPYTNVSITQTLNKAGNIRIIEITEDLDLGYNLIKDLGAASTFENWDKNNRLAGKTDLYCDPYIQEAGISKINIINTNDLIIYSRNGSKITHAGFNVSSCKNVQFRNIEMDEIWMWEDSVSDTPTLTIGDYDAFGWAYFKISFSEDILIDHCTFGKSFDGQIDYSNPYYLSMGTYSKAPYLGTGNNKLTISFCDFKAGSDDKDGYIYKMMDTIEQEYQVYNANKAGYTSSNKSCKYYFALRDLGLSFDDILYGIAIPQKKAFLWGDSGDPYVYNKYLNAVLYGCTIKNIEDRLPKVRGGMAYVYNTLVDNTEYYSYVSKLKSINVSSKNSKYKLGAVSQGILAGLDASVYLESVEYKGISSYLKNNDSSNSNYPTVAGGYMIKNSILGDAIGSSFDAINPFESLVNGTISTNYFSFKVNGEKTDLTESPLNLEAYDLITNGSLEGYFNENPTGVFKL